MNSRIGATKRSADWRGLRPTPPLNVATLSAESVLVMPQQANPDHFKEILARLAGGVAIITAWDQGRPHGLLVSSITGLSLDPPRFLFCVRKEASCHDTLLRSELLGVSILSDQDEVEAQTFMRPDMKVHRFRSERWSMCAPKPPLLEGGLSSASCVVTTKIDAGGHTIFIVTAQTGVVRDGLPLLSFNRAMRTLLATVSNP